MAQLNHVIEAQQFDRQLLDEIFDEVDFMRRLCKKGRSNTLGSKIMACLFYEPSTRTRMSFEAAMMRLGGRVLSTENAETFSSVAKGETLQDTIRIIGGYADVIVLRHKEEGSSKQAAEVSPVPIINAGDGRGQHPTQAVLDIYTLNEKLGRLDAIKVAMVGDLKHGRTVHSLSYLLSKYEDVQLYFVSPDVCRMKPDIMDYLNTKGVGIHVADGLEEVLGEVDCVYMTRIQKERFGSKEEYEQAKGKLVLTPENVRRMKGRSIIMHPLPRIDEIHPDVDTNPRAVYFDQAKNGLYVRMALLSKLLDKNGSKQ